MASTQRNGVRRRVWLLIAAVVALALVPAGPVSAQDGIDPENVGYLLERGGARTVAVPGAVRTIAAGLNDEGEIVGKFTDAECRDHGFLRNRWGRYVPIDVPGAMATQVNKINNRGQIVGAYNRQDTYALTPGGKGFVWERGRFTTIAMPGAVFTQALGIRYAGVVVGEYLDSDGNFHGFRWHRGRFRVIDVPGADNTSVTDINDHGDLVGSWVDGDPVAGDVDSARGFVLRNRRGARFESFSAPDARYTAALGINDRPPGRGRRGQRQRHR